MRNRAVFVAALAAASLVPSAAWAAPPGRGYEMVTPVDKPSELSADNLGYAVGTTRDGNHLFFHSDSPVTGDAQQFPRVVRADRGATGWTANAVLPAGAGPGSSVSLLSFAEDLGLLVLTGRNYVAADDDDPFLGDSDLYRFSADGEPELLSPNLHTPGPVNESKLFLAATEDVRGVVFRQFGEPLLPGETHHDSDWLYEFRDGTLRRVNEDDDGTLLATSAFIGGGIGQSAYNAYSRDGSHIWFTTTGDSSAGDRLGLWVRIDGEHTVPVPAAPAGANASSHYVGATPDGRFAYFVSDLQLTDDDHDTANDLYAFDSETQDVRRVSGGATPADATWTPVWPSDDGDRVYFTASGRLVAGQGSADGAKTYVNDHGTVRLVADAQVIQPGPGGGTEPVCGPVRLSPDGRYLLTQTPTALTADDTDGGAQDVYRYDAVTGETVRVSTGRVEDATADDATITPPLWLGAFPACYADSEHLSHPMSDDGRHVFFETRAALERSDVNGELDVYAWDGQDGTTALVSSGTSSDRSDFLDATPDGSSVFFTSRSRLVAADRDQQLDIYAARVGGGFPEPGPAPPACRDSECQGPPRPGPDIPPAASATLDAPVPGGRPAKVRAGRLGPAALRRLLRTGRATVRVTPARDGGVRVTAAVGVPGGGTQTAARVSRRGTAGKALTVELRLDARERRLLRRSGRLVVRVHQGGLTDVVARYRIGGTR